MDGIDASANSAADAPQFVAYVPLPDQKEIEQRVRAAVLHTVALTVRSLRVVANGSCLQMSRCWRRRKRICLRSTRARVCLASSSKQRACSTSDDYSCVAYSVLTSSPQQVLCFESVLGTT